MSKSLHAVIGATLMLSSSIVMAADSRQYYRLDGALTEDRFGVAVGNVGDVDGDGYADLLIGARYADVGVLADAGSVYLYSGKTGALLYQVDGDDAGDWFGVAVSGVGDLDHDGHADFVVGAQFAPRSDGVKTGAAYVYSGFTGARLYTLFGDTADGRYGVSVDGGKDVDGDGVADFVVGAYVENSAHVYSGATGAQIKKLTSVVPSWYGFAVALLPDINNDSRAEVVVTAPQSGAGTATVYSGASWNTLFSFSGEQPGDWFGFSTAAARDLNGDGKTEILIGAREASPSGRLNAGSVYIYDGASGQKIKRLDGTTSRDAFGTSVASAGDVNRDGVNDILIGARFALNSAGKPTGMAFVFSGSDYSQLTGVSGENEQDWFGGSVAAVGDSNGDGWPEWLVGSAGSDPNNNSNAGRAYVFGLKHYDTAAAAISAPTSARVGNNIRVSYTSTNNGEQSTVTTLLVVNGVVRSTASSLLDSLSSSVSSFSYTLQSSDFSAGRSSVCIKTSISNRTDGYSSDNVKCTQVTQQL